MNRRIPLLLLLVALNGCGGLSKPGATPALYDFGIVPSSQETVAVRLNQVEAAPGIDSYDMRYRLAYQNPARVFAFTESRWAALPADLIAQRMHSQWASTSNANCSLRVTLDVFDQIFDSPETSRGVVQLRAELANGNGPHSVIASTLVKAEKASTSADAKGGVAALTAATDDAITELKGWVNQQQCGEVQK